MIGGVGLYNFKQTGDDVSEDPGLQHGLRHQWRSRLRFRRLARSAFSSKAGSTTCSAEGESTNFIPITVGVRLGGS